ncbi:uncharacterized protein LOC132258033 [Phlebotomus argentipes]|uniref:uncharacterized protein LOC132258033 n=1 Tax=Phlebotomus argentipes TaxID=94469 RepID=UPI0028931F77|nr:uncharacterized protein LOC132258033 [Phlebotomus argentipes]
MSDVWEIFNDPEYSKKSIYYSYCFNALRDSYYPFMKQKFDESKNTEKPEAVSLEELISNSDKMSIKFPNERHRIKTQHQTSHSSIVKEASSVYPVILDKVLVLYWAFLEHKLKYGTEIEKSIYTGMSIEEFVDRLLTKTCVSFFGKKNRYLLRSGEVGNGDFKTIGTNDEKPPLIMSDYLTWDEIKLASFISISSNTENHAIISICAPQLDRKGLLDYQDMIMGRGQNCMENGYGGKPRKCPEELEAIFDKRSVWNNFYTNKPRIYGQINKTEIKGRTYRCPKALQRYVKVSKTETCDCYTLEKRFSAMITLLLLEANARAQKVGKMAYLWVNKFRMGLDRLTPCQEEYFFRIFLTEAVYQFCGNLHSVFCIHFENFAENCWAKDDTILNNNNVDDPYFWNKHPNKGIKIRFSPNSAEKDKLQEDDKLLYVSTYASSPNSLVGNEYWMRKISANKDSTAYLACHSFIAELHNPLVNRKMLSGRNLHIVSSCVRHISEYCSTHYAYSN